MVFSFFRKSKTNQETNPVRNGLPIQTAQGIPEMPEFSGADDPLRDVPRYPPFDAGIPVTSLDRVVASQQDIINRIYRTAGVSREEFDTRYMPVIDNLARYVHLLPATDVENHKGAGGMFCFALEVGLYSLQTANASIFPIGNVARRFFMQPKWSLATFIAGVCSQLFRVVGTMVVVTRDGTQWQPLLTPIYDWASEMEADRYFIRWLESSNITGVQASSAYVANYIVSHEIMQHLAMDNNQVLPALGAAMTGVVAADNPILKIVNPIITRVILEDRKRSMHNYGHMIVGAHLEPHLIDAMLRSTKSGIWTWNNQNAKVWIGTDGVFINWATAATDVTSLLTREGYAGIPHDPEVLCAILVKCGVFEPHKSGAKYWSIMPAESNQVCDTAVKLVNPAQIFVAGYDYTQHAKVALLLAPTAAGQAVQSGRNQKPPAEVKASEPVVATPVMTERAVEASRPSVPPVQLGLPPEHEFEPEFDPETGQLVAAEPPPSMENAPPVEEKKRESTQTTEEITPPKEQTSVALPPKQSDGKDHGQSAKKVKQQNHKLAIQGPAAERLLAVLREDNARLLNDIFNSIRRGKSKGTPASFSYGYAIPHEEITAHGRPAMEFIQQLSELQWLWVDRTKPTRNLHLIQVAGKQNRMLVLKPDIATALGFPYEAQNAAT